MMVGKPGMNTASQGADRVARNPVASHTMTHNSSEWARLTLVIVDVLPIETQVRISDVAVAGAEQDPRIANGVPKVEHVRSEIVVARDGDAHTLTATYQRDGLCCI